MKKVSANLQNYKQSQINQFLNIYFDVKVARIEEFFLIYFYIYPNFNNCES